MKRPEHISTAESIGADSWDLLNYSQLPKNASVKRQVEALRKDQQWQNNHGAEISGRIDDLIVDIEKERAND